MSMIDGLPSGQAIVYCDVDSVGSKPSNQRFSHLPDHNPQSSLILNAELVNARHVKARDN
ncbi:MAG: hypothetical protein ABSG11_21745 [Candidatus Korobacteraceae bacterium]|jgi:hypothetical protein